VISEEVEEGNGKMGRLTQLIWWWKLSTEREAVASFYTTRHRDVLWK
jgi:hypothetical protein